jgi:hypothetical protein
MASNLGSIVCSFSVASEALDRMAAYSSNAFAEKEIQRNMLMPQDL